MKLVAGGLHAGHLFLVWLLWMRCYTVAFPALGKLIKSLLSSTVSSKVTCENFHGEAAWSWLKHSNVRGKVEKEGRGQEPQHCLPLPPTHTCFANGQSKGSWNRAGLCQEGSQALWLGQQPKEKEAAGGGCCVLQPRPVGPWLISHWSQCMSPILHCYHLSLESPRRRGKWLRALCAYVGSRGRRATAVQEIPVTPESTSNSMLTLSFWGGVLSGLVAHLSGLGSVICSGGCYPCAPKWELNK